MPSPKFPTPKYNSTIDVDPQIVKIDINNMDWGSRRSILGKTSKDQKEDFGSIKHVESK